MHKMNMDLNWFQLTPIPANAMNGTYSMTLVVLSYVIAVLASYVALDLAGRLRLETQSKAKIYWLCGGAFTMGAGIWSMHFIGMLAFVMPMPMGYDLLWTCSSFLVAITASGLALFILRDKDRKVSNLIIGGVLVGLAIATMHYMGMQGMTSYVAIRYRPGLFVLSLGIAIFAAEAALWLALESNKGSIERQFYLKIISALIMGIAICGMHYTGMWAAVFTPLENATMSAYIIPPNLLAFFTAGITGLIIALALTASTYYKHMVNAVQNEKEFLNAMLDNLEDVIIACDAQGAITVFNDALRKNCNISKEDHTSEDLSDYFLLYTLDSEVPLQKHESPLFRALRGEQIHSLELIMKFKNGVARNVVIDGQPIININGNKLGAVVAIHDVTEIKKVEKMKSEFVSIVSHELRTPLTSIRGSLGLLVGGTVGTFPEKALKLLNIANRNCERLLLLINDILDMEKINAGKMKFNLSVVDINQLVNEAISTNKMYCDKYNVNIALSEPVSNVNVFVDPDRLSQVLANLISNAAKFSLSGSVINIKINIFDSHVRVSVCNKGAGIPLDFQSSIFQKFSQADSSDTRGKGGTGLGLSISKAIIEKLGGTMSFSSTPNEETIFYFDFPISRMSTDDTKIISKEQADVSMKLLICEDDEDQAKYLSVLLEGAGFSTDLAYTATEAKAFLAKNNYLALLLDLILPDEDGITLIRELRESERTKKLPIIVTSMIAQTGEELLNGDAFLVVDWLDKPINTNKLLDAISQIKQKRDDILPHILHVEDDLDVQHVVASLLEGKAKIIATNTIRETIDKLGQDNYDLVILDLLLPDGNGVELLPIFSKYKIPIIVYSAYDLDRDYGKFVATKLVKSKATNDDLLNSIKDLLNKSVKE
ncbi:MAG: MHYT domain-containing protein [Gammaproteobacteria bacterium]|nr:MHYT domain-containing protein [Gammaproteobacteria bacterium]